MLTNFAYYALPFLFTVLIACALTTLVSGLYLWLFRIQITNNTLRHPYLDHQPWDRYPFPLKIAMLLDYFLRLAFPSSHFWIVGHANRLLAHVDRSTVPTAIKWPLIGLWGGCFIGIVAMLAVWGVLLLLGTT
ncbi:hypothetical protein D7I39_16860 [Allopusillimonas ginsengisoli]|nr:hypothetical protein D7I39_16860 [Allopusillimonas ginsengisoli]